MSHVINLLIILAIVNAGNIKITDKKYDTGIISIISETCLAKKGSFEEDKNPHIIIGINSKVKEPNKTISFIAVFENNCYLDPWSVSSIEELTFYNHNTLYK